MLFFLFPPIQQALRVCSRESARRKQPQITLRLWNPSILRYQQQKARIPDCCAFFIEKNLARAALVLSPPRAFRARLYQHRRNRGSRYKFCLWIKPLHSPMSEFIEVSRETVGRKIRLRIIIFQSHWMSFFPSVGRKSEVLKGRERK